MEAGNSKICRARVQVQRLLVGVRQEFYSEKGQPFVLLRSSTDWTRPTHIREDRLLYSVYFYECESPKTLL